MVAMGVRDSKTDRKRDKKLSGRGSINQSERLTDR